MTTGKRPRKPCASGGEEIVNLSAAEIARATGGEILRGSALDRIKGVSSDSRAIKPGELFVPLEGPNFDGHQFIAAALKKGAAGALAQKGKEPEGILQGKFVIRVEDTLRALGDLAQTWRRRHPDLKVVALTGSNGKTTTKEMAAGILAGAFRVLKNEGNLNNLIGLPLTLLQISPEHEVAVLEMGMNHEGEIRRLREIAGPQVSLITNIGRAHLEFLGSLEGVARAKGELWEYLEENDWIAPNADDPWVSRLAGAARCRQRSFGILREADLRGEEIEAAHGGGIRFTLRAEGKKVPVHLSAFGRHNVYNALAAASLASILGIDPEEIASGLEDFQPASGRGRLMDLGRKIKLLDETYNSNPDSLEATLSAFSEMKGKNRGLLVMGDMLEVGPESAETHERAGRSMGKMGFAHLFWLGDMGEALARGAVLGGLERKNLHLGKSVDEILTRLGEVLQEGDWILVKGSRRMRLERVVQGLKESLGRG